MYSKDTVVHVSVRKINVLVSQFMLKHPECGPGGL